MNNKTIFSGENLYNLRKQKGLSQEELSNRINVSRQMISYWETGTNTPELENILKLCTELDVSIEQLLPNVQLPKNDTDLNADLTNEKIKSKRKVSKKKFILIVLLLIIFGYIIFAAHRLYIILDINNLRDEISNTDNYSCTRRNLFK